MAADAAAVLDDIRVLDLTGELGQYGAKLLADLGADVIKIEPPGGSPARRIPPFYRNQPGPNNSLSFWYFNTNKRSVTLDLDTAAGREVLRRLVPSADAVITDLPTPSLRSMELDYEHLAPLRPDLIMAKVSGFGEWGPHSGYKCPDIVAVAMSGMMFLAGFPDAPPYRPYGNQAYYSADIQAALGVLMSIIHRHNTGEGQQVEVSAQEALAMDQETAMMTWDIRRELKSRVGVQRRMPGNGLYECADGHVYLMAGVAGVRVGWLALIDWMRDEDAVEDLGEPAYVTLLATLDTRTLTALQMGLGDPDEIRQTLAKFAHIDDVLERFVRARGKQYLYAEGQRRRLMVGIVSTPKDLAENPQLAAHEFFAEVEHPELGQTFRYPGAPYHIPKAPWRIRRRAPLVGEHNGEVLGGELGLRDDDIARLNAAGVA